MSKIIGNPTVTPPPKPDWNQTDSTKGDYIKNKPNIDEKIETAIGDIESALDSIIAIQNSLIGGDSE